MIDPVLNSPPVITKADAMFVGFPDTPAGYMLTQEIGDLAREFSSNAHCAALLKLMADQGWDVSQLKVTNAGVNFNYPPGAQRLVRLNEDGPWLNSINGTVTLPDGRTTTLSINVGHLINVRRLQRVNAPLIPGFEEGGDHLSIYFENPNFPQLVWDKTARVWGNA